MQRYDGVVIGAGHNGLTLAGYLSSAGMKIAVLERNARIGGGTSTDEPTLPGYRFNLHSIFFMGFRHSPPIEGLYLCGSSTGNGGGINGAPGYIATNAIADDFKLERHWSRVPQPEWRH